MCSNSYLLIAIDKSFTFSSSVLEPKLYVLLLKLWKLLPKTIDMKFETNKVSINVFTCKDICWESRCMLQLLSVKDDYSFGTTPPIWEPAFTVWEYFQYFINISVSLCINLSSPPPLPDRVLLIPTSPCVNSELNIRWSA